MRDIRQGYVIYTTDIISVMELFHVRGVEQIIPSSSLGSERRLMKNCTLMGKLALEKKKYYPPKYRTNHSHRS